MSNKDESKQSKGTDESKTDDSKDREDVTPKEDVVPPQNVIIRKSFGHTEEEDKDENIEE